MKPFTAITGLWFFLMFFGALSLTACSQDKGDKKTAARQSVSGQPTSAINPAGFSALSTYVSANQQRVGDMIAAQWDPQYMGYIDNDSVIVAGYIETTANGQINGAASKLQIWVNDSYAKEYAQYNEGEPIDPYYIEINGQATGTANGSVMNVVFRGTHHEITLTGNYNAQSFNGNISVRNLQDFQGGTLRNPGMIGSFSIQTCGLLNCRRP